AIVKTNKTYSPAACFLSLRTGNGILLPCICFCPHILNHKEHCPCQKRNAPEPDTVNSILQPYQITKPDTNMKTKKRTSKNKSLFRFLFTDFLFFSVENI